MKRKKFLFLLLIFKLFLFDKLFLFTKIKPKISIFIPVYNKSKFLKRSIKSIQKQSLKDIEIIVVNDGSEDNSLEIMMEMAKNDSRIKIINNVENRGGLYSRTLGILNSKGEYLMELDADDELEGQDNLEYLYNKTCKSKVDIISFSFLFKVKDKNYINNKKKKRIFVQILGKFIFNQKFLYLQINLRIF